MLILSQIDESLMIRVLIYSLNSEISPFDFNGIGWVLLYKQMGKKIEITRFIFKKTTIMIETAQYHSRNITENRNKLS